MHRSDVDYWRYLQSLPSGHEDLPTPRVCRLLFRMFERWKSRPAWLSEDQVGHLFRGRDDLTPVDQDALASKPVAVRKALAIQRMLQLIVDPAIVTSGASCTLHPDELLVGTLPPFSVGQGKEFVRYLNEEEELAGALDYLNELSPMGHIVPNYERVLTRGLESLAQETRTLQANSSNAAFYESVAIALEAVIDYAAAHERMARALADTLALEDPNRVTLLRVADNLKRAPRYAARTFHEALQAIYLMHCALHWTVEIVPIGRLDQLLNRYLGRDLASGTLAIAEAQELIDCFWIKLDERAILTYRHAENRYTAADGVLTGFMGPSNFDQGGLLNQWMQQITIGGVLPTNDAQSSDACNDVTRLCLTAARRLPLNSPTLDLRVHRDTPDDVLELAGRALLSGGAHPVLLNDEIIIKALASNSGAPITLADARDYACDGCYETMVAGQSEFSFGFVSALDVIEKALNRGAGLAAAGPVHLRGFKDSTRTKPANEIPTFQDVLKLVRDHMLLACHRYLKNLIAFYGNKAPIAPSPLLSALITGCLETGRDLSAGGAKYHIFSPLLVGVSNAADSLHVISELVFGTRPQFSLSELVTCLATDWGHRLLTTRGESVPAFGAHLSPERISAIRASCLAQPKFGNGNPQVDQWAWWLLDNFAECIREARAHPIHEAGFAQLAARYGTPERPFVIHLAPGVGTFEQYVFSGSFNGASADGRRASATVASDLSPAPIPHDFPATHGAGGAVTHARIFDLPASLRSYHHPVMEHFGDGAPVDYTIPENYPLSSLVNVLRSFANGNGGSVCTFTAADPETFLAAQADPERHNLVRVRMGGWTEFFVALYPDHQEQHRRRPLYDDRP